MINSVNPFSKWSKIVGVNPQKFIDTSSSPENTFPSSSSYKVDILPFFDNFSPFNHSFHEIIIRSSQTPLVTEPKSESVCLTW